MALFKLFKKNHRVQSNISDVSFLNEFPFETKQVVLLQDFVHLHMAQVTQDLLWKGTRIHISSVIFVITIMLMGVFVCPFSFVNITIIPAHFYYFIFCFKFYYPTANIIVNHLYLVFLRSHKTNTKCCDKNEKNPQ